MYDEPYMDMLPKLGARVPYFMKNYPGKKFVVALHPATVVDHPTWTSDADYEEYVGGLLSDRDGQRTESCKTVASL